MQEKLDIHGYGKRMAKIEQYLDKLPKNNKDLILSFKNYLFTKNLSVPRILKYMQCMKKLSDMINELSFIQNKDLDKLTKNDIQSLVGYIQQKPYSPYTKHCYKIIIKKFICWVKNADDRDIPAEVKWIKASINKSELKLPGEGDLLTRDEVEKLINACDNIRDKTFLSVLYESGCRIGEIASLKINNLVFDKYGVQLNVIGKTGSRRLRLVNSSFLLRTLIETHPGKNNENSYLWIRTHNRSENLPMKYVTFKQLLKRAVVNAGIKKRCYPHLFRHSRATEMASHLTEFQMNQYFGWTQGSDMPSTYVHMNGKEVDSAILAMNGIKEEEKVGVEKKPVVCSRCSFVNPWETKFCLRCSLPLDSKVAFGLEQKEIQQKRVDILMNELIKEPEIQKMLMNKIKELGLTQEILQ